MDDVSCVVVELQARTSPPSGDSFVIVSYLRPDVKRSCVMHSRQLLINPILDNFVNSETYQLRHQEYLGNVNFYENLCELAEPQTSSLVTTR
jgi:hypothetical protein